MSIWNILTQAGEDLLKAAATRLQFSLPTDPVPQEWRVLLAQNVPLAHALSASDQDLLLRVARLLLHEVPFEGCDGLELTEEIRITIAATAALLVFRLPYPRFTKLVRVLVYPDVFVPKRAESRHEFIVSPTQPSLGEATMIGVVVLSWSDVRRDTAEHPRRGNVIIHEMAHMLDVEDGVFDGKPVLDEPAQLAEWSRVLERDFARQRDAVVAGEPAPLSEYAARNRAEFFAVAAESFYCSPDKLREALPSLYDQFLRFLRYTPLTPATADRL